MKSYQQLVRALLVCALTVFGLFGVAPAQRVVQVQPGLGILNAAINGDTTANGARVDVNTIYVLQRGGVYRLNAEIGNKFPLRIHAAEGTGSRPIIQPGASFRPFGPQSHLTLKGIYLTGKEEGRGVQREIMRVRSDNVRLVLNDCHVDVGSQVAIRFDTRNNKLYISKSIISNIGLPRDPNNGRGIDTRGNNQDSIVVENVTFYNLTSRALRLDHGMNNYVKFNHNTFVNIGQFLVSFELTRHAIFTNNLVINPAFFGVDLALDSTRRAIVVDSVTTGGPQVVNIRNNNFYLDPAIVAVYPANIKIVPIFNATAQAFINAAGTAGTNILEAITFTKAPPPPINIVSVFYSTPGNTPDWDNSGAPFDFAYPKTTASYTKSTAGQPLGALKWFGLEITAVKDRATSELPFAFHLHDNFPNPFNPATTIRYGLPQAGRVTLTIYNLLGEEVIKLVDHAEKKAGYHTAIWDGRNQNGHFVASGIYAYRMQAGSFIMTKKMALVK